MEQGQGKDRDSSSLGVHCKIGATIQIGYRRGKWLATMREDLRIISRYDGRDIKTKTWKIQRQG